MKMSITKMNREEKMLILKLAICTVICTLFAWLVKDPYRVTAAVTANLYLYIDRGYRGGNRYGFRRVTVQIVQGAILALMIIPCKHIFKALAVVCVF